MSQKIQVILTLDPNAQSKGEALVKKIQEKGLELDSVMGELGIITGKVAESRIRGLSRISGVTVERDETVNLAPPDAEVQ